MRRGTTRTSLLAAVSLTVAALGVSPVAADRTPTVAHEKNCVAVLANPQVPLENIEYLVPEPFQSKIRADQATDRVPMTIQAAQCEEFTIGDSTHQDTIWAVFGVALDGAHDDDVDPRRAQPPVPVHLDDYRFWYASNNAELVRFLQREGGLGGDAVFVEDLAFDLDTESGDFTFDAPEPTPSPFKIEANVGAALVGPVDLSLHHYHTTSRGWMVLEGTDGQPDTVRGLRLGSGEGRVFAEPGSQLDRVFCDDSDGSYVDPAAGVASFDSSRFTLTVDTSKAGFKTPPAECPGGSQ